MANTTFSNGETQRFEANRRARVNGVDGITWIDRRQCADGSGWMHFGQAHLPLRATRAQVIAAFGCIPHKR